RPGAEKPARLLGEWHMQGDDVRRTQEPAGGPEPGAGGPRGRLGRERIVRDDRHAEGARAACDLATDAPDPHKAERLGTELAADELRARPLAGADAPVSVNEAAEKGEGQGDGVLRRRDDVPERRV